MEDLISIVLPVYNGEKYLEQSIWSIINQTYKNWELIIVDDCSKDTTEEIANRFVALDSRIKYFKNEFNLRLPKNLNKGFSLTKGNYLTWTSDDNKYKPEAIEKMYKVLRKYDAQFVFASCVIIDENDEEFEYIMQGKSSYKRIVGQNPVGACFMYTRKVYEEIGGYDPNFTLVEDFDYWQRICMKFKFYVIEEILYEYRLHKESLTGTLNKDEFNKILEKMLLKNIKGFGKLDWEQKYYYYAGLYNCRNGYDKGRNPYSIKYKWYSIIFFVLWRIPNKIIRELNRKR